MSLTVPTTAHAATWDGQNPELTKCSQTAEIVKTKTAHSGKVELSLMYSTGCRTVWVEVCGSFPYGDGDLLSGYVKRNSDGKKYNLGSWPDQKWGYIADRGLTTCRWSPMLNDANVSSFAAGRYGSEAWLKTGSY